MRMRILLRRWKILLGAAVAYIFILIILSIRQNSLGKDKKPEVAEIVERRQVIDPTLTIIFQDFDTLESSVGRIVEEVAKSHNVSVLVISETIPYPPIRIAKVPNVRVLTTRPLPGNPLNSSRPESFIQTNFVLFMPELSSINANFMKNFQAFIVNNDFHSRTAYAIPVGNAKLKCHGLSFSVRSWTLEIGQSIIAEKCGFITGVHGLLFQASQIRLLSNPFLPPSFMSLYIQSSLAYIKFSVLEELYLVSFKQPKKQDPQVSWQNKQINIDKTKRMYAELGIKKVIRENKHTDWYGCTKESRRCFDTVYNNMPEFLYQNRWTPPCCLEALRKTTRYVASVLDRCKVRYWLEGGSLLGAVRSGDIIPWDYDVDFGMYQDDILKCTELAKVSQENFLDDDGYLWEKAVEGDFFRVQYSESNRLHVDIFPFYVKNGVMTKDYWFKTHKQDTEFPEKYLKPLTRITFAGTEVSAPNHAKEFLEYKFGKGVIESPRYPNFEVVV